MTRNAEAIADDSLSAVLVTYNSASVIGDALHSVREHMPGAEIIVVDNGSQDATVEIASGAPGARVISGHGNVGFGSGVNLGVTAASGDLILVINPDAPIASVDPAALKFATRNGCVGLLACRVLDAGTSRHLISNQWGWRRELYWAMLRWFVKPREMSLPRPQGCARTAPWISGAAFLARRSEFLAVGGFDDRYFLYFEDFDLSRSYRERALPIGTTNAVTVVHEGQGSSPRVEESAISWALLSLIEYVSKWEGREAAELTARHVLRLLTATTLLGGALGYLPAIGSRLSVKSQSAQVVRTKLTDAVDDWGAEGSYTGARAALRAAIPRS